MAVKAKNIGAKKLVDPTVKEFAAAKRKKKGKLFITSIRHRKRNQ